MHGHDLPLLLLAVPCPVLYNHNARPQRPFTLAMEAISHGKAHCTIQIIRTDLQSPRRVIQQSSICDLVDCQLAGMRIMTTLNWTSSTLTNLITN